MTATDTAVIADRFIDVHKFRVHYARQVPGTPWFCRTVAGPATANINFSQNTRAGRTQQSIDAISPC
jgi:hypothetical protein